jgi:hypothetical protein
MAAAPGLNNCTCVLKLDPKPPRSEPTTVTTRATEEVAVPVP